MDRAEPPTAVVSSADAKDRLAPGASAGLQDLKGAFERDVYCLMGLPIDALGMDGAVKRVRQAAFSNTRLLVSTVNVNFLMTARRDASFRDSVLHSELSLADGMPLVWVARVLGLPIRKRVSGAGLFASLLQHSGPPISVFFFGGPEGAAEGACNQVNQACGGLRCVGFDAPGFGSVAEMSSAERIERINGSGAQFVIVSLGAKKGQAWIEHNRMQLRAPVLCHLGAVVNFAAGTIRRAPTWVQQLGGEWLWRIAQEPSLWRRYWNDGVSFVNVFLRHTLALAVHLRWHSPSRQELAHASLAISKTGQQTMLELGGAWTHANLAPLRSALVGALARPAAPVLGMAGVTYVDNAFLALLMLAHGGQLGSRRLVVRNTSPTVTSIFNHGGAGFLLAQDLYGDE